VSDKRLFVGFLIALSLLSLTFFCCGLQRTNWSTLRGDEVVTLTQYQRSQSIGDLIAHGAKSQVSPAPLLYVVDLILDLSRAKLNYLGLNPPGYYRLPSLLFTAALGFGAALVVGLKLREGGAPLQYLFVLCGLAVFYFHPKVFALACTERPYGLWVGLWLFAVAWLLGRPPKPAVPLAILSMLAATATAACFQILAIGIALVIVRRVEGKSAKEILKEGALVLALPAVIGVYYALRSSDASYEERDFAERTPHFLRFWLLSNLHVWIAGGAMTWLALKRPALRSLAIPHVALTALIIVMPLVFTLSHMRGYSMVSRQYLWTSTAVPLALFFAAIAWPELKPTRYLRAIAVVAALGVVGGNVYATAKQDLRKDSRELALLRNNSPLMLELRTNRPLLMCSDFTGEIEQYNLELVSEWLDVRYRHLPIKGRVLVRDENGRLVADPPDPALNSRADLRTFRRKQ
jgi:hypothetical protein